MTDAIRESIPPLLQEDKDILHAVQDMWRRLPGAPMIHLRADTGNLRARRMLSDAIRAAPAA